MQHKDQNSESVVFFGKKWFFAKWEDQYIHKFNPSIEYLELLGVCMAVHIWQDLLKHRRIILFCDNQSVMTMINNTTSKCRNCMILIRKLVLLSLKLDTRVFCRWVRGKSNVESDMLSRQKISQFKKQFPDMEDEPSPLSKELWPVSVIWRQFKD